MSVSEEAIADSLNYSQTSIIPIIFKGVGIFTARITIQHQTQNNGTWTVLNVEDLRG